MPSFLSPDKWISAGRKDDRKSRAIKVVDLLEHAVELGNTDALYKLAEVSMVCPTSRILFEYSLIYSLSSLLHLSPSTPNAPFHPINDTQISPAMPRHKQCSASSTQRDTVQ